MTDKNPWNNINDDLQQFQYLERILASAFLMKYGPCVVKNDFNGKRLRSWVEPMEGETAEAGREQLATLSASEKEQWAERARAYHLIAPDIDPKDAVVLADDRFPRITKG